MATYIKTLVDNNGDEILPRTRTSAITTSDGTSIEDLINSKQNVIDSSHKLSSDLIDDTNHTNKFVTTQNKTNWNAKSTVSVSASGTATDVVKYITIDGVEKKVGGTEYTAGTGITIANNAISNDVSPLVPAQATSSNQLADKAFVNSSVQTATANFRGNWSTWSAVPTDGSLYPEDYTGSKIPTVNDYMVVQDASGYTPSGGQPLSGTWRFKYTGVWATNGKSGWKDEYQVNETPMTAAQLAAINSGITAQKVATYDGYATTISEKEDTSNKTTTLSSSSTNTQYPGAKAVYDEITNHVYSSISKTSHGRESYVSCDNAEVSIHGDSGTYITGGPCTIDVSDNIGIYADSGTITFADGTAGEVTLSDLANKESAANKVTSISSSSTNTQYPSAKAVYDYIQSLDASAVMY